jgi:hypothetical protein
MLSSKFGNTKRRKIFLAPKQARYRPNDIVFERSDRGQFGNNLLVQFPEGSLILAGEEGSRGIGAMFDGGMKFFDLN